MTSMRWRRKDRAPVRRAYKLAATLAIAALASLGVAAPAMAGLRGDLERFANCPYNTYGVSKCVYGVTTSGEFILGKGAVPVTNPVTLQGGINGSGEFIAPTTGTILSKTPEPVPGGLAGISLLGNFNEVNAIAELAGTAKLTNAVYLPLKTRLENPALGENCYIGTDEEPVSLVMTYGPDAEFTYKDHQITIITGTLEDESFAAPGASGCTALPPVGDLAVNEKEGLPAASGNSAKMFGSTEEVSRRVVKEVLPLPEFGRCVKQTPKGSGKNAVYTGGYTTSSCTTLSVTNEGKYEWLAGAGSGNTFSSSGGAATLQTVGGTIVKCSASSGSGTYTGAKDETGTVTLTGCASGPKSAPVACQSSGASAGEIRSGSLEGGIDFIKENEEGVKPVVGLDLKGTSGGDLLSFECGGAATTVSGSVIVPITSVDKMSSAFQLSAKETSGNQSVEAFEEGSKDTLGFASGGGEEAGGLTARATDRNAEALEIKAEM